MEITESKLQNQILKWLLYNGHFAWRQNNLPVHGRRFVGLRGIPDIFCILPPRGRFLAIECKTGRGRQDSHQREFEAKCVSLGGLYVLARKIEDVIEALEDI